jgi:LysM repeat protein
MALPDSSNPTSSTTDLGTAPRSGSSTGEHGSGGQATTKKPTAKNDENPAAPTPVKTDPPASTYGTYTIRPGDTLSKIAKSLGVTVSALCAANGLTISSVIYAGKKLAIPGGASTGGADSGGSTPASAGANVTLLTAEGEANARTIISIGRELGVSEYGIVIALATAMQESTMRNLNYGHLDSVGLFQQRPASGWGTAAQLTTPTHAARLFYGGPQNPNKGKTRGLLDIAGWQSMTLTQAAQKVQISGHPTAYAKWEASARYWLKTL